MGNRTILCRDSRKIPIFRNFPRCMKTTLWWKHSSIILQPAVIEQSIESSIIIQDTVSCISMIYLNSKSWVKGANSWFYVSSFVNWLARPPTKFVRIVRPDRIRKQAPLSSKTREFIYFWCKFINCSCFNLKTESFPNSCTSLVYAQCTCLFRFRFFIRMFIIVFTEIGALNWSSFGASLPVSSSLERRAREFITWWRLVGIVGLVSCLSKLWANYRVMCMSNESLRYVKFSISVTINRAKPR